MENDKKDEVAVEVTGVDAAVENSEIKKEESSENVETKVPADEKVEVVTPELLKKIKSQVEFYFGDINMQRDKFLIEQTKLDEGWIPMTIMMNFKMLVSLSKDIETILKAISDSDLMEISEDRKKIRRTLKRPLPTYDEEYRKSQAARTVYVKGFPLKDVSIRHLKEFFKDFEPFENIVMRKYQDKEKKLQFKGSIFVQFETLDGAKAFMARESVKFGDTELVKKFSEEYSVEKAKEREERKQKTEVKGKKTDKEDDDAAIAEEVSDQPDLPKGSVLHFTGAAESTDWEDIKKTLMELGAEIAYVDFKLGDKQGWIRLQGENAAKPVIEKMKDNKLEINGNEVSFKILENEEEDEYLKTVKTSMASRKQKSFKGKHGRSRRGRGGARGRKRHGSPMRDSGSSKKAARV